MNFHEINNYLSHSITQYTQTSIAHYLVKEKIKRERFSLSSKNAFNRMRDLGPGTERERRKRGGRGKEEVGWLLAKVK